MTCDLTSHHYISWSWASSPLHYFYPSEAARKEKFPEKAKELTNSKLDGRSVFDKCVIEHLNHSLTFIFHVEIKMFDNKVDYCFQNSLICPQILKIQQ